MADPGRGLRRHSSAPRHATIALALVAVVGCSKHNPTRPPAPSEMLGTPVTAPQVVLPLPLLWSASTDELIGSAWGIAGALMAVHATSGATRLLDTLISFPLDLSPDGSAVYYDALGFDDVGLSQYSLGRRLTLSAALAPAVLDSCAGFCFQIMKAAPDGEHVAVKALYDSLRIHALSTGEKKTVGVEVPLTFSPASDQLLVNGVGDPLSQAAIVTLATGATQPANLGVPDLMSSRRVRWGPGGIEVLYVETDEKSVSLRRVSAGTTTRIWSSADTLAAAPSWSPSGGQASVWSSRRTGTAAAPARRWELHLVDLASGTARTIAYGEAGMSTIRLPRPLQAMATIFPDMAPGEPAFSPDGTQLAYAFLDGRLYRISLSTASAAGSTASR